MLPPPQSAYTRARARMRDQQERLQILEMSKELGSDLLASPSKSKTTILTVCWDEGRVMLLDTLSGLGFADVDAFRVNAEELGNEPASQGEYAALLDTVCGEG